MLHEVNLWQMECIRGGKKDIMRPFLTGHKVIPNEMRAHEVNGCGKWRKLLLLSLDAFGYIENGHDKGESNLKSNNLNLM